MCTVYKADGVFSFFQKLKIFFLVFVVRIPNKAEIAANNKNIFFSKLVKLRIFKARNVTVRVTCNVYHNFLQKNEK